MAMQVLSDGAASSPGEDGSASVRSRAVALLERGECEAAALLLQQLLEANAGSPVHDLLGTAFMRLGKYEEASTQFEQALRRDPKNDPWKEMRQKAIANATSGVDQQFPPEEPFDREELLAPPLVPEGTLPVSSLAASGKGVLRRFYGVIGRAAGAGIDAIAWAVGPFGVRLQVSDEVWTNWYRKPLFLGLMTLSYMRQRLDENNLKDTYPPGRLTAFQKRGLMPPAEALHYRTADGSWNNLENPKEGAAGIRFPRNVAREVTWPAPARILTPNPAELSQELFTRAETGMKEVPFLNLLAAVWIQFQLHDWVSHRTNLRVGAHAIPLPASHPARRLYHQTKMFVAPTAPDPTRMPEESGAPPTYINEVTSWWDASQIYGSDARTADRLRTREKGKLHLDRSGHLPVGKGGIEDTGFNRNWWVGLSLLHTLFVKEHNVLCDMLRSSYGDWDDTRLYHVARLINAAVIAKIHTVEWTPAILPNRGLYTAMNTNWYGLIETALRRRADRRIFRRVKVRHPEFGGILGNSIDKHGAPYALPEEFTEVYRLHELLPDELDLRRWRDGSQIERIALAAARQAAAPKITGRIAMDDLLFSFGIAAPGQLVLNNYPKTLQELSIPGNPVYDLAAVDIFRARERGVPRYNEFRRQIGLKPIRSFDDLTDDKSHVKTMMRLYDNDIEALDLLVGTRAEGHRPSGFGFGETMFQIFILNASRRLQADRFFTDDFNEQTYSPEGIEWIERATFKQVLLRHHPHLAQTGLANVVNAFEPWDTGKLDPARHPLAAFA